MFAQPTQLIGTAVSARTLLVTLAAQAPKPAPGYIEKFIKTKQDNAERIQREKLKRPYNTKHHNWLGYVKRKMVDLDIVEEKFEHTCNIKVKPMIPDRNRIITAEQYPAETIPVKSDGGEKLIKLMESTQSARKDYIELRNKYQCLRDDANTLESLAERDLGNGDVMPVNAYIKTKGSEYVAGVLNEANANISLTSRSMDDAINGSLMMRPIVEYVSKNSNTNSHGTQTDVIEMETQTDDLVEDMRDELFPIEDRKKVNERVKKRKLKNLKAYSKLTYFLKCKYFMKSRDHTTMHQLIMDARIWMLKSGMECTNYEQYLVMTSSVMAAFIADQQELVFRKLMKDPLIYDGLSHITEASRGDLGKKFWNLREHSRGGALLQDVGLPRAIPRA